MKHHNILAVATIMATAFILASCGDSKKPARGGMTYTQSTSIEQQAEAAPVSGPEAVIFETVQNIYDEVVPQYCNGCPPPDMGSLVRQYCTEDFKEDYRRMSKLSAAKGEAGIGFDFWIMAQDWEDLSVKVVSATMKDDDEGYADIEITNCGTTKRARIEVEKEHGVWKIDDFIDCTDGRPYSAEDAMEHYLGE